MDDVYEIRNSEGRKIGRYNPKTLSVEIKEKNLYTVIRFLPDGSVEISETLDSQWK